MTESPVDPVHDDHGDDADEDSDAEVETPPLVDNAPEPDLPGEPHPDPPPGDDGM